MQPEQQQRIMGYFIEEAKDHLNTIEQGLLNLQSTIEDQEMVNELFRAAHSVKGGAAMLGLNSIQQVSHRLEDYFKILKESPIKVDQKLESLFLQVFDALQELVGQLQGPFGLTDETANATVAGVEHVFEELETHLTVLASNVIPTPAVQTDQPIAASAPVGSSPAQQDSAFILLFQNDIPLRLREMLQLFKQPEVDAANRQQLQDLCHHLISIGEQFDLSGWCQLVEMARAAIAHPNNAYRTLAPIIIRDIKQAQELVLSGRASDIVPCAQLQALQPISLVSDDIAALLAGTEDADWLTEPQPATTADALFAELDEPEPEIVLNDSFDTAPTTEAPIDQHGPEVGMAELNSLADLFEGEVPDLGSTWQEEEIITDASATLAVSSDASTSDDAADFSDLLFDEAEIGQEAASTSSQDALTDLFSDDALPSDLLAVESDSAFSDTSNDPHDLNDLFAGSDATDLTASTDAGSGHEPGVDFDDVFNALNLDAETSSDTDGLDFEPASTSGSPLDDLGDLFADMDGEQDLTFSAPQSDPAAPVDLKLDELDNPFVNAPDDQSLTTPTAPSEAVAAIVDPWEEVNPIPLPEQPTPSLMDDAIVPSSVQQADAGSFDDDLFGDDHDSTDAIEELSDQDDLDFTSLLESTTAESSTPSFSDPLVEELMDDGLDPSFASLLADDAAKSLRAEADFEAVDQPLSSDEVLRNDPVTVFSTDLPDPWAGLEAPQQQAAAWGTPKADELSLDLDDLDFAQTEMASTTAALTDELDIDFNDLATDNALDTNLLDVSDSWLTSDRSKPSTDPVRFLEAPFAEEADADTQTDSLNDAFEDLPDFNSLGFDASSESLPDAFDDLTGAQTGSAAEAFDTDAFDSFFDEPNHDDGGLELPEDLLTIGVSPNAPSDGTAATLSDDLLGLGDLDRLDDLDSIATSDEDLDLSALSFISNEFASVTDNEATDEQLATTADDLFASTDIETAANLSAPTNVAADEASVNDDPLGLDNVGSIDLDGFDLGYSDTSPTAASEDSLDFGDELFGLQTTEDSLDFSDDRLTFDDDRNDHNGIAAETSSNNDFSLEFESSDFDALGFDSPSAEAATTDSGAFEDFDWGTSSAENATSDSLLDLDDLLDDSPSTASTNTFETFDQFLDEGQQSDDIEASSALDNAAFDNLLDDEANAFGDLTSLNSESTADDDFSGLEAFLDQETSDADALSGLDDMLNEASDAEASALGLGALGAAAGGMLAFGATGSSPLGDFSDLESLLQGESLETDSVSAPLSDAASVRVSEFDDLDDLLKDAEEKMGGSPTVKLARSSVSAQNRRPTRPGRVFSEQTMRVPVKHLDNLSNLVGELVVNRNSLEEDQERLRQSLDNLLYQVQQLSDVGQRMQDLYERSLLESSLLASRQSHRGVFAAPNPSARESGVFAQTANATGIEYDPLEMDRFTGFHSLSQEMIELIVRVRESASDIEFIVDETDQVTRMFRQVTTQLQEGLTRSRMVPFAQTADRLPRAVRDIAMKVGKQAELSVEGRETLIDKMILEQLYDPMTHLVNNAITHGIESPEVRRAAGKPPAGRITIRAFHQGNQTIISVSDDGAGIDIERVKAKAIEKGLITSTDAKTMTRLDVYDLLFHAGFSTKDQADDFSGRGVGMDVVRTSLSEIRGAINTDSTYGKGTTFTIRLPLTLSISKALCCISDRARIAFPMDGVEDMLDVPKERIQTNAEGQACIPWRDSLLPLRPLNELLAYSRHLGRGNVYGGNQEDDIVSIVVLRSAGNFLALQVDQVLGEQEIVIKQLEGPIPKPVGVAGATVLGDGRIMPIADVLELIDLSMGRIRKDVGGSLWEQGGVSMIQEAPIAKTEPTVLIVDDSITVRELLSMTFNKVGYRVEQARDGQEAWEKLRAGLPCDIVFCDIEMPRMDGLELLSRIQKDPNLSHLPIAMLTSRGADRHRQMAVSLGASGYFTKPYLEEALLDAAQRMLKGEVLISSSNA
ncbi:hybrid sensor histidine kinase/response regulator [Stenomitos frigidus]|uniref:histidine kinase n=1 Tax=Stenomitos frigidus ULC18 TaxID=2107698 RepID=A0A2T1DZ87_9CYAN|nr:hybrid sensor histidine kinase/response regulator [Stenomitos frigidus]PSB25694.1 two-component hybrid sensor and regulator [Stenomitos frigidus ULC18]